MTIKFLSLHIHHFLSFDDSIIDLHDKGYCLVSGVNKNPRDAAKSNGSGKSTIWNAISYALTGETLNGLKSNLPNIYFDDGCWVELTFEVDKNIYKITRSKNDATLGTNLKIVINGEDKSGKGIKESQVLLETYLPDLTSELLGSVIILGQGLPTKFTSNSPSGRKEVLEHLSKSDFMIQDLKDRIANRLTALSTKMREIENKIIELNSQEDIYTKQLASAQEELQYYSKDVDFDSKIKDLETKVSEYKAQMSSLSESLETLNADKDTTNEKIIKLVEEKSKKKQELQELHNEAVKEYNEDLATIRATISQLNAEIVKMKAIKDVCPTCGQKIPNVIKPDTSKLEQQLETENTKLNQCLGEVELDSDNFKLALNKLDEKYAGELDDLNKHLEKLKKDISDANARLTSVGMFHVSCSNDLTQILEIQKSFQENKEKLQKNVADLQSILNSLSEDKVKKDAEKHALEDHIDVVNKMNTSIKRDFRGILLKNVIDFIDTKAKEYASKIFNSDNIEFVLDGNDINILFEGKDYDNLSGGEKQRLDIIIQFAIRDMMSQYLGFSSNILVLDEITDALDSISCDKVINFITEELRDIESVFIVSHHSDALLLPCDCEIVVEKNEFGVSEVK